MTFPPHVPTEKPPSNEALIASLTALLRSGLPLTPQSEVPALLSLRGVWARAVDPTDPMARVDAADRLVRAQLKKISLQKIDRDDVPLAAQLLFGITGSKGKDLTSRRRDASRALGYNADHFRKHIEPAILAQLAWQLHQDSLQYVPRGRRAPPPEASGDTPTITAEDLADPERAEHEELLSRIWSDVYRLRAELIARERWRGDLKAQNRFEAADEASLDALGRLLLSLDDYLDRHGSTILHGAATYDAHSLIRLAGWTGELTEQQARDARWRSAGRRDA